jgi:hypothetical protein
VSGAHPLGAALAGVLLFAIGLALGGGLLFMDREERGRMEGWQRAEARVTEIVPIPPGNRALQRMSFTTAAGERISFTVSVARTSAAAIGDRVSVLYLADDPRLAVIDNPARRRIRNGAGGAAALALIALGAYVAVYASRLDRPSEGAQP